MAVPRGTRPISCKAKPLETVLMKPPGFVASRPGSCRSRATSIQKGMSGRGRQTFKTEVRGFGAPRKCVRGRDCKGLRPLGTRAAAGFARRAPW